MSDHKGFTLWMTGLSGSGKSTITEVLIDEFEDRGIPLEVLDGDVVRENLSKGLGFSKEDRDTNITRIGFVADLLSRNGVPVIAFTNVVYADTLTTQHSSGKKLKDIADIVIDNCSLIGDAAIELEGLEVKVGATSTIPVVYMLAGLLAQTCELLLERGVTPDVYYNGHLEYERSDVREHNQALVEKYRRRMRNL